MVRFERPSASLATRKLSIISLSGVSLPRISDSHEVVKVRMSLLPLRGAGPLQSVQTLRCHPAPEGEVVVHFARSHCRPDAADGGWGALVPVLYSPPSASDSSRIGERS